MPLYTIVNQPGCLPTATPGEFGTDIDAAKRDLIRQLLDGADCEPEPVAAQLRHLAEGVNLWDGPDGFLGPDGMNYEITWYEDGESPTSARDDEDA
jgi:hypothetical protein